MKYLKTFENFDFGDRFSDSDTDDQNWLSQVRHSVETEQEEECAPCSDEEMEEDEKEIQNKPRVWGDEVVEGKKAKPDFLDLDKDGNKKESMKKAAKDAKEKDSKKEDKKEEKGGKGLSAAQKKLPAGLQKAILAKKNK